MFWLFDVFGPLIWSNEVALKRSSQIQFRCVDLRSIEPLSHQIKFWCDVNCQKMTWWQGEGGLDTPKNDDAIYEQPIKDERQVQHHWQRWKSNISFWISSMKEGRKGCTLKRIDKGGSSYKRNFMTCPFLVITFDIASRSLSISARFLLKKGVIFLSFFSRKKYFFCWPHSCQTEGKLKF